MEDFIELGIEGVDKVVDKHFHKLPDAALQSQTYHPREIRKKYHKHRHGSSSSLSSESETESAPRMSQDLRQNYGGATPAPPPYPTEYSYVPYSSDPPHQRPEYMPSPPPIGQVYYPPSPPSQFGRQYKDEDDGGYYSDRRPQRPRLITRRSSSYHGPRDREDYGCDDRQLLQRRRRGSSRDGSDMGSRSKDVGHRHGLKEVEEYFTKSPVGITGAVAGAVVGGWAAKKAQVASGREAKHHGSNPFMTLLGAAAGGLAVNAVIDKFEDRKKETAEKQEAWEEKWGSVGEDRDNRRGRRGSHRRRHRSRSYSNDRYD